MAETIHKGESGTHKDLIVAATSSGDQYHRTRALQTQNLQSAFDSDKLTILVPTISREIREHEPCFHKADKYVPHHLHLYRTL